MKRPQLGRIRHGLAPAWEPDWHREIPGAPFKLIPILPESRKMRGFLEGGIILLVACYQEGMHHRDPHDGESVRNWLKEEFNDELITIAGVVRKIDKSTKRAGGSHRFHGTRHDLACRELPATNRGN